MATRISLHDFAALAEQEFGTIEIRRAQAKDLKARFDVCIPRVVFKNPNKVGVGLFRIPGDPELGSVPSPAAPTFAAPAVAPAAPIAPAVVEAFNGVKVYSAPQTASFVPEKDKNFVAWGNFHLIKKLLSTPTFLSLYVTGETGNGKTFNFEQAAAALGREMIAVNFTAQTDEDDLIGGFRLINGDTVWVDGPVIEAMKRGAILLLDEVDLSTEPVMALQSVLQGKPYFIKKLGRQVSPAPGFMVVATANTKGDGDGDYVYTNILNKAFLDRFKVLIEQPYPPIAVERKIISKFVANNYPNIEESWVTQLTRFVDIVRNTYKDGGISEQISTRRAVDMTQMYGILGNAAEAIKLTTNRFDEETQAAMLTLWDTIDSREDPESASDTSQLLDDDAIVAPAPSAPAPQNAGYPHAPAQAAPAASPQAPNIPF